MFRVGQKVVYIGPSEEEFVASCHKSGVPFPTGNPDFPEYDTPYTVCNTFEENGDAIIELVELKASGDDLYYPGFLARNFRPLVEKKTDISIFKKMLTPKELENA